MDNADTSLEAGTQPLCDHVPQPDASHDEQITYPATLTQKKLQAREIAECLLRVFHHLPQRKLPVVFSADISPSLLNLMLEPDSKLQAVCGVEPYSYGRLILRAACDPSTTGPIQVSPVHLNREEILEAGVGNYAQLLARYPNMLLNEAEYAWPAWMREKGMNG